MKLLLRLLFCAGFGAAATFAAEAIAPDLKALAQGVGGHAAPTTVVRWDADAKGRPALFANSIVWLDGVDFGEGTIEVDILGKSLPRGSNFPGVVFHAADDTTWESIYFRPFNFRAENPENASHAVQYTCLPQWPWPKLRAEKTGQYEKPIAPAPDGDAWFHAQIVVTAKQVQVFVNGAATPSLVVERLTDRAGGRIGITGGDAGDGGHFANLKITPKKS